MVFQAGYVARLSESVKIHSPAARVFLRFPKVSRHSSCMDHAILHGKPFGIPLLKRSKRLHDRNFSPGRVSAAWLKLPGLNIVM